MNGITDKKKASDFIPGISVTALILLILKFWRLNSFVTQSITGL